MWSEEGIAAADLPLLAATDIDEGHTAQLPLSSFTDGLKPRQWTRVRIPLDRFRSTSLKPFVIQRLGSLVFAQGAADAKPHTLYLDDIRIDADAGPARKPSAPMQLEAEGYERHIDLDWTGAADPTIAQ